MNDIINDALNYVKTFFEKDFSGHDYYHTFRVYKIATNIAKTEECDSERVKLTALLHDVDDYKISPTTTENLDNARSFLTSHGKSSSYIDKICYDIKNLSFSKNIDSSVLSIEGKIVQDSDRLDAIGAIGIARTFAYGGANGKVLYNPDTKKDSTIKHFYDKLLKIESLMNTNYGKTLAKERTIFLKTFLDQFYKEWNINN